MITRLPFVVCVFSLFCMLIHLWIHLFYCICFSFDELATFDLYHCLHSVLFTLFLFSFLPSIGAEVVEPWSPSHFFKKTHFELAKSWLLLRVAIWLACSGRPWRHSWVIPAHCTSRRCFQCYLAYWLATILTCILYTGHVAFVGILCKVFYSLPSVSGQKPSL